MAQVKSGERRNKSSEGFNRQRAFALMDAAKLDALIATSPENVAYVSGFHPGLFNRPQRERLVAAIIARDPGLPIALIIPHFYLSYLADRSLPDESVWTYGRYQIADLDEGRSDENSQKYRSLLKQAHMLDSPILAISNAISNLKLSRANLALDEDGLSPHVHSLIYDSFISGQVHDSANLFKRIRMVKTKVEVEKIRVATKITEQAMQLVIDSITPGTTERELEDIFRIEVARKGAHFTFACMPAGIRSAMPACLASKYAIRKGDLVKLDAGCMYELYHSDVGRTAVVGMASAKQKMLYRAMLTGVREAIEHIKPGIAASELYDLAMTTVKASGIPHFERSHCGHGQGLEGYEQPLLTPSNEIYLEEGMILNIEAPYNEVGFGGMIVEETVLVTANGHEQLTNLGSDMYVV